MTQYIRGASPVWFWFNTIGQPVNDTYYAFFLQNTLPYNFQTVYQDSAGSTPWSNPIEFQTNAGLPDNIYFNPSLVYRIEIRQGPSQTSPLIGNPIQNYVPAGGGGSSSVTDALITANNAITNPQFTDIDFVSSLTYVQGSPGTYTIPVGPGWNLVLTGAGTTVLSQGTNPGSSNIQGNPAYYLTINNSGWNSAVLEQTLSNNGSLFANGAVAVAFSAFATTNPAALTIQYQENGLTPVVLFAQSIPTGGFIAYSGYSNIGASTNGAVGEAGFVNINFVLPSTGIISLSNIQITGQSVPVSTAFAANPTLPLYQEQSYEQMVNNEFNYYNPLLQYKPIPSYLTGWDFPLNPAQFLGTSVGTQAIGNNKSYYAWDQTIIFQSLTSGFAITKAADGSLSMAASVVNPQGAFIQYLAAPYAVEVLNHPLSVNIEAYCDSGQTIVATVSLWYTTNGSLPSAGSGDSVVTALNAEGYPTVASGWTEVPRNLGTNASARAQITIVPQSFEVMDYPLTGWSLGSGLADSVTFFAIVLGTGTITNTKAIYIRSISLVPGSIATIPAPQKPDEVLRECQYYYEKSYEPGVIPGTASTFVGNSVTQVASTTTTIVGINTQYKVTKNSLPAVTWYSSSTGSSGNIYDLTATSDSSIASNSDPSSSNTGYVVTNSTVADQHSVSAQWVADARLGV